MLANLANGPLYWLQGYAQRYPHAWSHFEYLRKTRTWPAWCFMPIGRALDFMLGLTDPADLSFSQRILLAQDAAALAALSAWRMTKGVYKFDPTLQAALWDTPLTGVIPTSVLFRLREWCVYIALNDIRTRIGAITGMWVHLEWDPRNGAELRFLFDGDTLRPLMVRLGGTLLEGIPDISDMRDLDGVNVGPIERGEVLDLTTGVLSGAINMVLYLCSARADIAGEGRRGNPQPVKTKRGMREFAASKLNVWDVGVRIGATLRGESGPVDVGDPEREVSDRSGPRPHIRRAHWHTYLVGPRDEGQRRELRWLHPTLVNALDAGDLPVTVHPVKGPR